MDKYRHLFPVTKEYAYMDHAAGGPVSLPVIEAVNKFLTDRASRGSLMAADSKALCERTRTKLAAFIGASVDEIAFMKHTPDGLNAVANGIKWLPGDNVVTADIEFPANIYPWMNLRDFGVELKFVSSKDGRMEPADVIAAIDDRTRVVALSWVEFHGGFRNDLAAIGAECRNRDVFLSVEPDNRIGNWKLAPPGKVNTGNARPQEGPERGQDLPESRA
jgi:selenocysteine lyase/cysteine desulfurase